MSTPPDVLTSGPEPRPGWWHRRAWAGAAVAIAVAIAVVVALVRVGGDGTPDLRARLGPPLDVPMLEHTALTDEPLDAVVPLRDGELWAAAAGGVWHGIAGALGTWYAFGSVERLAVAPDGRVWIVSGSALRTFDGRQWREVQGLLGAQGLAVAGDGAVWTMHDATLVRYDGRVTVVDRGAAGSIWLGDIVASPRGGLWATGLADYLPYFGSLQHFDGTAWAKIHPLGGSRDVPARLLAATADGGLWAWLQQWNTRPATAQRPWRRLVRQVLARYDGQGWQLVTAGLPPGAPHAMAARDGTVWLAMDPPPGQAEEPGIFRWDGAHWSHELAELGPIRSMAVGPDGALWVDSAGVGLRRVATA